MGEAVIELGDRSVAVLNDNWHCTTRTGTEVWKARE